MTALKKYWPLVLTILGVLAPMFSQPVDAFWASHPGTVAIIAGAWASLKWLLPSPLKS
jgi:hypothetical protein